MAAVFNQKRIFLGLLADLRPHLRTDRALPGRIQSLLTRNKSFGSRDRRLYRELLYTAVRFLPIVERLLDSDPDQAVAEIAALSAESPATSAFRSEFSRRASACGLPQLVDSLPAWFRPECPALFESPNLEAINRRAPLWLRVQARNPVEVAAALASEGIATRQSDVLATALEVVEDADVTRTTVYAKGAIEIQDLGSQLVLESAGVERGARWLDACAGAGGKTLQLADLLGEKGSVDAHDIRDDALEELNRRAERAGLVGRVSCTRLSPGDAAGARHQPYNIYDGVLVDAPCSGSGTWRRSPHLKWTTTPESIAASATLQGRLLDQFSAHVRPGGLLVYATCSLSHRENQDVVASFLQRHTNFTLKTERTILPAEHNTDGFYVAVVRPT